MRIFLILLMTLSYVTLFSQTKQVCGSVLDPTGGCVGFAGVTVNITDSNGTLICEATTGPNGTYCCEIDISDFPVIVCPEVHCPFIGIITEKDIEAIQKYILGLPYDDTDITKPYPPYYGYWADVNGDGKVTAQDLGILRKAIYIGNSNFNLCRIVSKYCLDNYDDTDYYDGFCLNQCQWVEFFSTTGSGSVDFELFHIGDVYDQYADPDCKKPLQQDDTEIRSVLSMNTEQLIHRVNHDRTTTAGFNQSKRINMLLLSVEVGAVNYEDIVFHVKDADYELLDGVLYITYFSEDISNYIEVKDLFSFKQESALPVVVSEDSYFIEHSGIVGKVASQMKSLLSSSSKSVIIHENAGNIVIALDNEIQAEDISSVTVYNTAGIPVAHVDMQNSGYAGRLEINNLRLQAGAYILRANASNGLVVYSGRLMVVR